MLWDIEKSSAHDCLFFFKSVISLLPWKIDVEMSHWLLAFVTWIEGFQTLSLPPTFGSSCPQH